MDDSKKRRLSEFSKTIRYWILRSTTEAGSGHPTSALSSVELMVTLLFGGLFRADLSNPNNPNNDRLIFSKGHAAPLLYALYTLAGAIEEKELLTLRKMGSRLEGHPAKDLPFVEAPTGSLGQGLSVGVGLALNAKLLDELPYRTYVLLGDSEMSEGAVWEAIQLAAHYKLNNLVGVIDVNRLGQRGETMYGHDISAYAERLSAFGWRAIPIDDGHDLAKVFHAYHEALTEAEKPTAIIAKTLKGKGVSFTENKEGWHGKALSVAEFDSAEKELGPIDVSARGALGKPQSILPKLQKGQPEKPLTELPSYKVGDRISVRRAYGVALVRIGFRNPKVIALDAEVKNSTFAQTFEEYFPKRYFEMYIAEQNMVGIALGLSLRGKIPFVSTFAAFFTRTHDQLRMLQYANANVKFAGSFAGVSINTDGPSQMGLEDIALFRGLLGSIVLYPSDAVSCEKLIEKAIEHPGIVYLRVTRNDTPVIYGEDEQFQIGKCKILKSSENDSVTVIAAGITLHETRAAYEQLKKQGIFIRVVDLYSIKPIDIETLTRCARETQAFITVEDHYPEGGIGEAVRSALFNQKVPIHSLAVTKQPTSGTMEELLDYEDISKRAIVEKTLELLST